MALAMPFAMGGRGAVAPAIAIWLGLLLGQGLGPAAIVPSAVLGVFFALLACRAGPGFGSALLVFASLAAATSRGASNAHVLNEAESALVSTASPCWVRGVVTDHPWVESGEPAAFLRLTEVEGRGGLPSGVRVRLWLPPGSGVEWGDRLEVLARLETHRGRRVPGGFDARAAARSHATVAQGRALAVRRLGAASSGPRVTFVRWRRAIEEVFRRKLSTEAREIVTPLVVGDRTGIRSELAAGFQAAGLTHLLALSGLHVVWMAAVARGLVALLGGGVIARGWAGAACAILYLGIAGPLPSLVRAAVAEGLAAWGWVRDRAIDPVQSLAAGAALILCVAPGWAGDLGFQLSCAATMGLVTIGAGARPNDSSWLGRAWKGTLRLSMPTLAAQAAALPLLLARFHSLPWTTLGANLLAVPVCELLLASAWLGALLEILAPGASRPCFAACEAMTSALRWIVAQSAAAPVPLWPTGHLTALPWLAGVGAVALSLGCSIPRTLEAQPFVTAGAWWARALGMLALALTLVVAAATPALVPPRDRFWVVALDVGQGDAIALGFADGWWLVDAGPGPPRVDAGRGAVLPFLRWVGARSLDTVVLTHAHADHTGGATAVLTSLRARRLALRSGMQPPADARRDEVRVVAAGDTLRAGWPAIHVRWPPREEPVSGENAASIVLQVGEAEPSALLAADVDSTIEASLGISRVALLKVAHHGAGASSGATALADLRPRMAAISCGRRNPFRHPDAGALARLRAVGASVHRTDLEGTLWFEIGTHGITRVDWRSAASFDRPVTRAPAPSAARTLAGAPARW